MLGAERTDDYSRLDLMNWELQLPTQFLRPQISLNFYPELWGQNAHLRPAKRKYVARVHEGAREVEASKRKLSIQTSRVRNLHLPAAFCTMRH